jgi:putative protease
VNKCELLSPAGDTESFEAAILYGADAVYVGAESFGLRANAGFDTEALHKAVAYARERSVRVYLTCNIVANNADAAKFPQFIKEAVKTGIDAVIVSDLGLFDLTAGLNTDVHISTQAGVMNYAAANMLHRLGAKRVILARELSLGEIRCIRENTPPELELEAFVHGAMCVSFSGRCLISNYLAGRDANRGQCCQPCRWKYHLMEESRAGEFFPVYEDERGMYLFNSKDLCMIEHVGELLAAGVTSLKIEGRAKTAYYTALITNAYRAVIDEIIATGKARAETTAMALNEVNCVSHRPYCTGFYFTENREPMQSFDCSGYIRDCDFVGVVDSCADGVLEITQRNYFTADDFLEVISPGKPPQRLLITAMYNSKGERVTTANHAVEKLRITDCALCVEKGSFIRRVNSI